MDSWSVWTAAKDARLGYVSIEEQRRRSHSNVRVSQRSESFGVFMSEWPQTAKCMTNGCDEEVTRASKADPRFCSECRKEFGRRKSKATSEEYLNHPARRIRDSFTRRLTDGFTLLRDDDQE